MTEFTIHTPETASAEAAAALEDSQKNFGMIPNLHAVMAEAPKVLDAYKYLSKVFTETTLTPVQQNVIWLEINVLNECHYCVPAHTAIAYGAKVPEDVVESLRNKTPIADGKLEALRQFTRKVVEQRGHVADADIQSFLSAGYTKANVLEVVLGAAHKTLSNYVNHIVDTPVDAAFQKFGWKSEG
ncbi:carboxymuconolactone decarboxylase family protein [Parvularcula sp. IMCC14364]|uniref:carboxymuconolactone decarboxylase family protein n=1 Tax=Parvularcula sp. IMCC14364 TaxID=3067902 RepID=UPI002740FB81|nr:carboxymuconolactone decarboxylase family protein [Parvularcula sp. IMCC14364]